MFLVFKFAPAIQKYTESIEIHPTAACYSNRAQANLKQDAYGSAIADADSALELDPSFVKGEQCCVRGSIINC